MQLPFFVNESTKSTLALKLCYVSNLIEKSLGIMGHRYVLNILGPKPDWSGQTRQNSQQCG